MDPLNRIVKYSFNALKPNHIISWPKGLTWHSSMSLQVTSVTTFTWAFEWFKSICTFFTFNITIGFKCETFINVFETITTESRITFVFEWTVRIGKCCEIRKNISMISISMIHSRYVSNLILDFEFVKFWKSNKRYELFDNCIYCSPFAPGSLGALFVILEKNCSQVGGPCSSQHRYLSLLVLASIKQTEIFTFKSFKLKPFEQSRDWRKKG